MSEHKILYQDKKIKLETDGSKYYLTDINSPVYIFPYTITGEFPNKIGVLGSSDYQVITIEQLDTDTDIFATAKRGLKESTGFSIDNPEKWDFLGVVKNSHFSEEGTPSFSIDITGAVAEREDENNITDEEFNLVAAAQALECENAIIHSLFLKTFQSKILNPILIQ